MKKVRTIIWDLDETVWFYNDSETKVICQALKIDQLDQFTEQYYKMWNDLFVFFEDVIVTYAGMKQYIESKIPILKCYNVSIDDLLDVICNQKEEITEVNEEAIEMLKYFNKKGLKNISITDWFAEHQKKALLKFDALKYFQDIYGCDDTYFKNCEGKISQIITNLQLQDRKEEYIMIGDSLSSDIAFAQKLGIKSVWFNRKNKLNETNTIPTYEVKSLLELKEIF